MTRSTGLMVSAPIWAVLGLVVLTVNTAAGIAVLAVAGMALQAGLIGYAVEGALAQGQED